MSNPITETELNPRIKIGVSQCLLGDNVRFDGSHKKQNFLTDHLTKFVEFVPVCPEVAIGMGVPRKPIRIMVAQGEERVRGVENTTQDFTEALSNIADQQLPQLHNICGYIFTQNSPSCGVFTVKRYNDQGALIDKRGRGIFAQRFMQLMPLVPVEEAGRLHDTQLRENFLLRIFALSDWKNSIGNDPTPKKLIDFYSRYKYQVMANHLPSYYEIGALLSDLKQHPIQQMADSFIQKLMHALSKPATRKTNANVLMHLRGYLKKNLNKTDKNEISRLIESYAAGYVPLAAPMVLLKHHVAALNNEYLNRQVFWNPYPHELNLAS